MHRFEQILHDAAMSEKSWADEHVQEIFDFFSTTNEGVEVLWDWPDEHWPFCRAENGMHLTVCTLLPLIITEHQIVTVSIKKQFPDILTYLSEDIEEKFTFSNLEFIETTFGRYGVDRLRSLDQVSYTVGEFIWSTAT